MKRVPNAILFVVTPKTSPIPSILTLHQFTNRIPCQEEDLFESNMIRFVDEQMENYPITKQMASVKLNEDVEVARHHRSTSTQLMKFAYDFINQSNYLLIEETRSLLYSMNEKEISENQVTLEMLKKSISQCINRDELNDYAALEIQALLEEITKIQNKKSSKWV